MDCKTKIIWEMNARDRERDSERKKVETSKEEETTTRCDGVGLDDISGD